jgi:hypothetical protein
MELIFSIVIALMIFASIQAGRFEEEVISFLRTGAKLLVGLVATVSVLVIIVGCAAWIYNSHQERLQSEAHAKAETQCQDRGPPGDALYEFCVALAGVQARYGVPAQVQTVQFGDKARNPAPQAAVDQVGPPDTLLLTPRR